MPGETETFKNSKVDNNYNNVQGVFEAGETRKKTNSLPKEHDAVLTDGTDKNRKTSLSFCFDFQKQHFPKWVPQNISSRIGFARRVA